MLAIEFQVSLISVVTIALWFIVFSWLVSTILTIFGLTRQRTLSAQTNLDFTDEDSPLVSVLVPARNEEHRVLAECIRSILAQDYGNFEVIAVDDRSTDATGTILEGLVKEDSRLRFINGEEPPHGWLGKPYAMQQALDQAKGEWILATDADMIFHPTVLRTAMSRVLAEKADAITIIPKFEA